MNGTAGTGYTQTEESSIKSYITLVCPLCRNCDNLDLNFGFYPTFLAELVQNIPIFVVFTKSIGSCRSVLFDVLTTRYHTILDPDKASKAIGRLYAVIYLPGTSCVGK